MAATVGVWVVAMSAIFGGVCARTLHDNQACLGFFGALFRSSTRQQ